MQGCLLSKDTTKKNNSQDLFVTILFIFHISTIFLVQLFYKKETEAPEIEYLHSY